MFQAIVVFVTFIGSLMVAAILNDRQRMFFIPFFFAYRFAAMATFGAGSGLMHFLVMALGFIDIMVMCNGFPRRDLRNNPVVQPYLLFFVYMVCAGCFGYHVTIGLSDYFKELMIYGCGYFMASWACRTEGAFRRLLLAMMIGAYFVIAYTAMHGGFSSSVIAEEGRGVINADLVEQGFSHENANSTALRLDCILPFLLILFLLPVRKERDKIIRMTSCIALVIFALLLIRTGSRGGTLALLPCAWYFLYSTRNASVRQRRIALGIVVGGILSIAVFFTMKGADQIRALNFSAGQYARYYDTTMDAITSGRWGHYERLISRMTPLQKAFGAGFSLDKQEYTLDKETGTFVKVVRPVAINYHSMLVTIFIRTGYVGSLLYLIFFIKLIRQALRCGERGKMAFLLLGCWLLPGLGESWPMGGGLAILAGFAMGLVSNRPATNSELQNRRDLAILGVYPPPYSGWR